MAFNQNDLYLTSGTGQLINNWTDPVYKFDSSSFYNWEQDNLPLYDLEERDDFLYEMVGWPTSAAPSVMLTVSDCGIDNKKVFGTLSGAIDALPSIIRQPVIIEVCVSGQLGPLNLQNTNCVGPDSGIEIINRGFAKVLCGSGAGADVSSFISTTENGGGADGSSILTFKSADLSTTLTNTFSVGLSGEPVGSKHATTEIFWNTFNRSFVITPEWNKSSNSDSSRTVSLSAKFRDTSSPSYSDNLYQNEANKFSVSPIYSDNSTSSDIVIRNPYDDSLSHRPDSKSGTSSRVTGFIYANTLDSVVIKNCNGNIYIRGFCVDGADQADITTTGNQRTDYGIIIEESDVVVENCTVTRCKKAGLICKNSDITLNRGFIATHNYELETNSSNLDTKVSYLQTPGLRAINSNVTLSSTATEAYGLPIDSPFCFTKNFVGVELVNSVLKTPTEYKYGKNILGQAFSEIYGSETLFLQTFLNINQGIKMKNSLIDFDGYLSCFQNRVGADLVESTMKVAEVTFDHNQDFGLLCNNSTLNYNKNAELLDRQNFLGPQTRFIKNGQHVVLTSSEFVPTEVSGMDTVYSRLSFSGVFGLDGHVNSTKSTLPSIVLENNSYMNAVCSNHFLENSIDPAGPAAYVRSTKGAAFKVSNSSVLDLKGTGSFATIIVGPYTQSQQKICAGLYAENNSTINIAGPTSISQYGVDVLAENNSTINIGPHKNNGTIDVSGFSLDKSTDNHTKVQLHSTRASLVVSKNSNLNLQDIGDYHAQWDSKYLSDLDYPTANDATQGIALNTSSLTYGGFLQFFSNPLVDAGQYNIVPQSIYPTNIHGIDYDTNEWVHASISKGTGDFDQISIGGMCVRALEGSKVNAKNVHFPAGWPNASGAYYDLSATNCELLRIWNIADNSQLHASYLSVDGTHPQDSSGNYFGPSALWTSAFDTGLSGAPSSTPDTSGASILDYYGLGVNTGGALGYYGKTSPENIGAFRLYVSPDPKAKLLGYPKIGSYNYRAQQPPANPNPMGYTVPNTAELVTGVPYQVIAQGYNPSGDCSAINNQGDTWENVSSVYQDLGFSAYIESLPEDQRVQNVASSFFYTSALLADGTSSRIWLDESALNTFANAKNGLLSTSGRKKIFNYYNPKSVYPGEGFNKTTEGKGFGSAGLFDLDRNL